MNKSNILPGFRPAISFTLLYLSLVILIPLSTLVFKTLQPGAGGISWQRYIDIISNERVVAAFRVSFLTAFIAAGVALILGFVIAWTLVRYSLPAKRFFDAIIDLPFALPTAVAGIVLASLYAPNGILGKQFAELGIKIAFTPAGIVIALIFIGLPFVVRTVEPVLQEIDSSMEEAASSLGASRWQVFSKIIFPNVFPAALTGFSMAFARGIGEYGSVIFIAGNIPYVSEIVPLLIITRLEQYDYAGATALALTMLVISFILLLIINLFQLMLRKRIVLHRVLVFFFGRLKPSWSHA